MDCKIILPESACRDEVIDYIASRYSVTPARLISLFMRQEGIMPDTPEEDTLRLKENEIAIMRDMGFRPSRVEFAPDDSAAKKDGF